MLHSALSLRHLVDVVGADHVVLGSDYPFVMGEPEPVRSLDAVPGLGDGERQRILAGNLATLLDEVRCAEARAVDLTVNGTSRRIDADPDTPLLHVLRGELGLRGRAVRLRGRASAARASCWSTGAPVPACDTPLWAVEGRTVTTVEGLADGRTAAPGPAGGARRAGRPVRRSASRAWW